MKPRYNPFAKKSSSLALMMGAILPGMAGAQTVLIDAATRNGSFETLGGVTGSTAKATHWDTDSDGDVNDWTLFPGVTAFNDSGTEANGNPVPSNGIRRAFLQNGNAAYNMTTHVIQAGDTFNFQWDALNAVAHNVSLIYNNGGTLTTLGTPVAVNVAGNNQTGTYTVVPGDPAIGKTVGVKLASTGGWPGIDNVRLSFTFAPPADSDNDTLPDVWELANFNDLDEVANGDPDLDGLTNAFELNTSLTHPAKLDTDGDTLGDGAEVNGTSNVFAPGTPTSPLLADSDGDHLNDFEENGSLNDFPLPAGGGATNPNNANTDGDLANDYEEIAYHSDPNDAGSVPEPSLHDLISNTLRNGSFELRNGAPNTIKTTTWDAAAPNDIDNWIEWTGTSTVADNSGVEGGGSHGAMRGYFRSGNAAYNLTPSIALEGSVYSCTWKQVTGAGSPLSVRLVYQDGVNIVAIPASIATTNTGTIAAPGLGKLVFRIPAGSPAIGKPIGVGISSVGNWIGVDEVVLNVADGDSDEDGLGDFFEDEFFGNNDGVPTPAELALQDGNGDFDNDGLINVDEITFGTLANDNDSDNDTLLDGAEVTGSSNNYDSSPTNPLSKDSDNDGVSDLEEKGSLNIAFGNAPTDPNSADSDNDTHSDKHELAYGSNPNNASSIPQPVPYFLINNFLRNGSFELRNGAPNTVKTNQWDAPAPDNIDNWTEWTGVSVEANDSGVEAGGSHGEMRGFFQSGNAAYNLTNHIAASGSVYTSTWKHIDRTGILSVQLVYDNNGTITPIPASIATTTGADQTGDLVYRIPAGSPAIGKAIGIGVSSSGGYMQVDEFALSITAVDSDHDGLADLWEMDYFHDLDEVASGDPDNDGVSNIDEQTAGTNPTVGAGNPDADGDGMTDTWEIQYFTNVSQTAEGDFEGDGTNNLTEFRLGLDPTSGTSRFVATAAAGATRSITWTSVVGATFKIERSTTLQAGSWTVLEAAFPGTAGTATYTDATAPAGKVFYKVGLNP